MPQKRKHYEAIKIELLNLISKKDKFIKLYGSKESVELLNSIDGHCFGFIQRIYNDSIVLSLTKLLDPKGSGNNKNIVLETLINDVNNSDIKIELYEQLEVVREISQRYKKQRNKVIAHSDYKTHFKEENTYFAVNDTELNEIIALIILIINKVEETTNYPIYSYELIYDVGADCETLLYKLKKIDGNKI